MHENTDPQQDSTFATVQRAEPLKPDETELDLGKIGPYKLLRELGRGGMGAVYLAKHANLQRTVVIKVLPREFSDSPDRLERFRREMAAIGRLEHPNIVLATDAGEADGFAYIAMQYVEGSDVSALHKKHRLLKIADACEIVRQASIGLQHVSESGLVHRDIKPSNLFLTKNGEVKILDLGLAMLRDLDGQPNALTSPHAIMGTPDFIAPEQINACHRVDIRADIYSLGCTLYTLLSGKAPFEGQQFSTATSKLVAHAEKQAVSVKILRSDVPIELVQIVEKMMAKSPNDRFSQPVDVAQSLANWSIGSNLQALADSNATSDRLPTRQPSKKHVRISRKPILIIGCGCLTVLGLMLFSRWNKTPTDSSQQSASLNVGSISKRTDSSTNQTSSDEQVNMQQRQAPVATSESLSTVASSIDRTTQEISKSAESIDASNQKVEENTRRIAQSFDELLKRLDGPLGNKLVNNPQTPGEHYYNAIVYGAQGNPRMARQSFLSYFEADEDYIDPHLKFIESVKLQEGTAAVREIYKSLPGDRTLLSRQFAEINLLESDARKDALQTMASRNELFAPCWYALSNWYSASPGGQQTLFEASQETHCLKKFVIAHEQGGLLKYYLDQSQAAALVGQAETRLKALASIDSDRIEHPISMTIAMKIADNWQVSLEVAEPAKEIFYRVGDAGEFQSTGIAVGIDPATGKAVPKKFFTFSERIANTMLFFRYVDLKDQMRGPFSLPFNAQEQTTKWELYSLAQTKPNWLRLSQDRLFFDVFQSGRSVLRHVRYGVDSDTPQKIKAVPKAEFGSENAFEYSEAVSPNAKYAVIQLVFVDGKESEIVRIDRR
jgi:serine/threonine protein kinase